MPRETPSPIDLPDVPLSQPGLGWTSAVIAGATLLLLAFNAVSLRDWAEELTPGPAQAKVAAAAEEWLALTEAVGLATPRAWLHARWKAIEQARFGARGEGGEAQPPAS